MIKPLSILITTVLLLGCVTKHYPQALPVSPVQNSTYDCNAIKQEIEKSHDMQKKIDKIGEFDARTALAVIGDFGIGNGIVKYQATKDVNQRLAQLEAMKAVRCKDQIAKN